MPFEITYYFAQEGCKYCNEHVFLLAYLNKNSSGDEIANVKFFYDHIVQYIIIIIIIIILWAGVQPALDPYAEAFIAGPLR